MRSYLKRLAQIARRQNKKNNPSSTYTQGKIFIEDMNLFHLANALRKYLVRKYRVNTQKVSNWNQLLEIGREIIPNEDIEGFSLYREFKLRMKEKSHDNKAPPPLSS